jgi:flagellar basal-body rod protein FlgF
MRELTMENALLIGLSRQVALQRELDVVANNVANIGTNGFKSRSSSFAEYLMPKASADAFEAPDRPLSYVIDSGTILSFENGPLERTGNPLDIAIGGKGVLAVQTAQGERYTRNGSLQLDSKGQLVTSDGYPVLGTGGALTFSPQETNIQIGKDGVISTSQGEKGKLKIMEVKDPDQLDNAGFNVFSSETPLAVAGKEVVVEAGTIERSNVRPVFEMSRLIEVNRAYATLATMMQRNDELRRSALEQLANVTN